MSLIGEFLPEGVNGQYAYQLIRLVNVGKWGK